MSRSSTFPRSGVLVLGNNSIKSLLPATTISQAESLLQHWRIEDAIEFVDQQRKKLQSKLNIDEDEVSCITFCDSTDLILPCSGGRASLRVSVYWFPMPIRHTI